MVYEEYVIGDLLGWNLKGSAIYNAEATKTISNLDLNSDEIYRLFGIVHCVGDSINVHPNGDSSTLNKGYFMFGADVLGHGEVNNESADIIPIANGDSGGNNDFFIDMYFSKIPVINYVMVKGTTHRYTSSGTNEKHMGVTNYTSMWRSTSNLTSIVIATPDTSITGTLELYTKAPNWVG